MRASGPSGPQVVFCEKCQLSKRFMLFVHIDIDCLYEAIPMCTNNMLLKKSILKFTLLLYHNGTGV